MQAYQGFPEEDVLLVGWWNQMVRDGELDSTLGPRYLALSQFFAAFRAPATLFYETDGPLGIALACWLDPSPLSGAFVGLWIHPAWRRQRRAAKTAVAMLLTAFQHLQVPVLLFATDRPDVAKLHRHVGAVSMGCVPELYGGSLAYVSYLTPQALVAATTRYREAA